MSRSGRFALAAMALAFTVTSAQAQTTSTKSETKSFEIIAVDGNDLVVKLPEGTRNITVPPGFTFMVNGQPLQVQDLKPGMTGTATITTTTRVTPVTVTEVKNGTVRQVSGGTIIVQTPEGFKMFTQSDVDKRGVKIMRHGEPAQVSDFRTGDMLTATIITTHPPKVVTEKEVEARLAGASGASKMASSGAASSGATSAGSSASSAAVNSGTAAAGTGAAHGRTLPKTASTMPLIAVTGVAAGLAGLALARRRRLAR